eukprot:CAMPEP_0117423326 /NCGR_PEP_ID=MMETSP0758-20121206/3978_1 /TAXON_ID=63605 /ORGANISM="Percolomonas cosmopolitus, Strain AE-1 (ATCC 50343)" /LENGTH=611 /DNA_ID=CAMNT_0005206459 /DNA_START=285 /DNA_END=2120 /DNA_ORIENTATION=+
MIFAGISGAIPLLFQLVFGDIIAKVSEPGVSNEQLKIEFNGLALNLVYVALGAGGAQFFYQLFGGIAQTRIGELLRKKYFGSLISQELAFFDKEKTGELMNHLSEGVTKVEIAVGTAVPKFAELATQALVGLILAFTTSWMMSILMLAAAPVIFILIFLLVPVLTFFHKKDQELKDESAAHINEMVSSMKTIRTMGGELKEMNRFNDRIFLMDILGTGLSFSQGIFLGALFASIWGLCAYSFYIGGVLVIDGIGGQQITFADMMKVFGYMLIAIMGAAGAIQPMTQIMQASIANSELWRVINRKPTIPIAGGERIEELKGEIEFRNVSFAYPTHPDTLVLKNFSYTFEAGKKVALVGQSGSGKSTIVSLIARFYDPVEGDIFIDGVNIKELDPVWLHRVIGMVTQEPVLFQDTIRNNIKYSIAKSMKSSDMKAISDERVEQAAKDANAHHFIEALDAKYSTVIGERGTSLSGGQKQRVAIARAILQDPTILLLDEATSALDTESESIVQKALDKLIELNKRTSVAIAHRLSTIQDSDEILVFVKGELIEQGTHDELLAKEGVYAKLAEKQMALGVSSSNLDEQVNDEQVNDEQSVEYKEQIDADDDKETSD